MKLKAAALALFAVGLVTGLTLIAPATGADGPTTTSGSTTNGTTTTATTTTTTTTPVVYKDARDAIRALSDGSITVGSLTCSINASSPSRAGFKVGDRVKMYCGNGVLAYLLVDNDVPATTTTTTTTPAPPTTTTTASPNTGAVDAIKALTDKSITVGPLTCSIGAGSPAVTFKVGDRVKIYCTNGVLAYIFPGGDLPAPPKPPTSELVTRGGTISALGGGSITVEGLTCLVKDGSPSVAGFKVGDKVGVGCQNGVLVKIAALTDGGHDDVTASRAGVILALGQGSITVDGLTCLVKDGSPSLAGFEVGDKVGIGCLNGVLMKIVALPNEDQKWTTRLGRISALSPTSITVDGLTCAVKDFSPSLDGYKAGDLVGIGCLDGVLLKIGRPLFDDGNFRIAVQLGAISDLSDDSITVGRLTCKLASSSPSVSAYEVGDKVGIGCAGGILFMIGALPKADHAPPKAVIKAHLMKRFAGCVKKGHEHCTVAGILRRLAHK